MSFLSTINIIGSGITAQHLRLRHGIGDLLDQIHVRELHIALFVGVWVGGIILQLEVRGILESAYVFSQHHKYYRFRYHSPAFAAGCDQRERDLLDLICIAHQLNGLLRDVNPVFIQPRGLVSGGVDYRRGRSDGAAHCCLGGLPGPGGLTDTGAQGLLKGNIFCFILRRFNYGYIRQF